MAPLYPRVPLGDVGRVKSGYAYKRSDWTDLGVQVIKIPNVRDGWVTTERTSLLPEATAARTSSYRPTAGDLLSTVSGEMGARASEEAISVTGAAVRNAPVILMGRHG